MSETKLTVKEWSDKFGDHYQVSMRGLDGRIYSKKVTKAAIGGWPKERATASEAVRSAALSSEGK